MTWSFDCQLVLNTNTDVDCPNAQVSQFEGKDKQVLPEYSLAQHLEIF